MAVDLTTILIWGGFGLAALVGLGLLKVGKANMRNAIFGGLALGVVGLVMSGAFTGVTGFAASTSDTATGPTVLDTTLNTAGTLSLNAFTGPWGKDQSETEVYPVWTVVDGKGNKIVNDATANSTAVVVGDKVDLYCTGASQYCDPIIGFSIDTAAPTAKVNAYAISAAGSLQITAFDENDVALTLETQANKTSDYSGGDLSAGEVTQYTLKFQNRDSDNTFDLGMICTWYPSGQEVDDVTISLSGWSEVSIPKALRDTSISSRDDGNASTTSTYKHCYAPSAGKVRLNEFDKIEVPLRVDTDDSTAPTDNGDSYVGAVFMDAGYGTDGNGAVQFGAYMKDASEDPGAIGLDENPDTTWVGRQTAVEIELN